MKERFVDEHGLPLRHVWFGHSRTGFIKSAINRRCYGRFRITKSTRNPVPSNDIRESNREANQNNTDILQTTRSPAVPPTQTKRDFWDKVKTGAEIVGIFLLAIYTGYTIKMYYANKKAADAAKSAADTAEDALHISERAYIIDGPIAFDIAKEAITIPIVNSGHIPSGPVEAVVHEATVNTSGPTTILDLSGPGEHHWGKYNFPSIPAGWPLNIAIPAPQMSATYLNSGRQAIIVAGFISYNDGFPDTPQQQWFFCQRTTYHIVMKQFFTGPCKPSDDTLHKLELIDGYPNNPEP